MITLILLHAKMNLVQNSWKFISCTKRNDIYYVKKASKILFENSENIQGRLKKWNVYIITAALMGNIMGETDVCNLLMKVFQTSAYNLKANVNTAQKVNCAN